MNTEILDRIIRTTMEDLTVMENLPEWEHKKLILMYIRCQATVIIKLVLAIKTLLREKE